MSDAQRAKAIFVKALEDCHPEKWEAYLDQECGSDSELRDRVRQLLSAHQGHDSFFDAPPPTKLLPMCSYE